MRGGRGLAWFWIAVCALVLAACGTTSTPSLSYHHGAEQYTAQLSDLDAAGFTITSAPALVKSTSIPFVTITRAAKLSTLQLKSTAMAHYFRPVPDILFSNGPLDVISYAEQFPTASAASQAYSLEGNWLQAVPTSQQVSPGPIGDEALATVQSRVTPTSERVIVLQYTILWRMSNIIEILYVRQRYDGNGITDAATIAANITMRIETSAIASTSTK
ncbi:MAG: hypothetical protein ACP5OR_03450 [Candidatus Dormibacteria bacterium]